MLAPARLMLIAPEWTPLAIAIVRPWGEGVWFKAVAGRAPGGACLVSKALA